MIVSIPNMIARVKLTPSGCWEFDAIDKGTGYGRVCIDHAHSDGAHRVMWGLVFGPIPEGLCVLHRCDNRPCVNPLHLFLGTKRDNFRDMVSKGRAPLQVAPERGEDHRRAKLSNADVKKIFALRKQGFLQREIAPLFGVTRGQISGILNGHTWAHFQAGDLSSSKN